jgi:hypothetical protein
MSPHDSVDHLNQVMMDGGEKAFEIVPTILSKVIRNRLWAERTDKNGTPFRSFEAFAACPRWRGLESSIDDLLAYCRKREDVQKLIKSEVDPPRECRRPTKEESISKCDNITLTDRGTSSTYALKRLKRDAPELFAEVVEGRLSANKAAIRAGFRKPSLTVPLDPEGLARAVRRHFTSEEVQRLIRALMDS